MLTKEPDEVDFEQNAENSLLISVRSQDFIYDYRECKVTTLKDLTSVRNYAKIAEERQMMELLAFGVNHEMITPLKCIVELTEQLSVDENAPLKSHQLLKKLGVIKDTASLLLH